MPKRVPFPQKSSQYSALKSVPKKFKKKVQKIVLKKVPKKVQTLLKVPKIVPKKVLFLKKVPKKALFKALLAGRNLYAQGSGKGQLHQMISNRHRSMQLNQSIHH